MALDWDFSNAFDTIWLLLTPFDFRIKFWRYIDQTLVILVHNDFQKHVFNSEDDENAYISDDEVSESRTTYGCRKDFELQAKPKT